MKINLLSKLSILTILLAFITGCGTMPVRNIDNEQVSGTHSTANIGKAIKRAGAGLGWIMKKTSDGHMTGTLYLRKHVAVVDITYNQNSYSINYKDSQILNYTGTEIHKNYNGWILNLNRAIDRQISIL